MINSLLFIREILNDVHSDCRESKIWRLFCEIFKFRDFIGLWPISRRYNQSYFREISLFCKTNYIFGISRSRASKWYITCPYSKSLKFFDFLHDGLKWPTSRKSFIKSRNRNIFPRSKMNCHLWKIPFKMIYNLLGLLYPFENCRWGGGAPHHLKLLFCKSV